MSNVFSVTCPPRAAVCHRHTHTHTRTPNLFCTHFFHCLRASEREHALTHKFRSNGAINIFLLLLATHSLSQSAYPRAFVVRSLKNRKMPASINALELLLLLLLLVRCSRSSRRPISIDYRVAEPAHSSRKSTVKVFIRYKF